MIASIILARGDVLVKVMLHNGEMLTLERTGDLGEQTAGMLIFTVGNPRPEYVLWKDIAQIEFSRPEKN